MFQLLFTPLWRKGCEDFSDVDENEEKFISESESQEDNYVTADEGYEADIETRDNLTSGIYFGVYLQFQMNK